MDIDLLRSLVRLDETSPSGLVNAKNRKRGSGKEGCPALTAIRRTSNGTEYYGGALTIGASGPGAERYYLAAHRVVFALVHGYWPPTVDHRDGDMKNNTPANLRAATVAQQQANKGVSKRSKSGFKGVVYDPTYNRTNPYRARIKKRCLGSYPTAEAASAAYYAASIAEYGEFAVSKNRLCR
ncbi:putative HNH endonuclease [Pseudomonas phage Ep4]|uniref:HNH endonuclease n=1 Tax=Pseudomonas phage Ep4 TaxID=3057492 RepID=A0AAU9EZC2_9CAUD|nr:putative HNH endonuclease [Pseudomonas phage Ep4]